MAKAPKTTTSKPASEVKDGATTVERGEVVKTSYDNEADDGAACQCTLMFADGSEAVGSAERTGDLAADQAAARAAATASMEA